MFKVSILLLALAFSTALLTGQNLNFTLYSNPPSGGEQYNDVWGYEDAQNNEYAIVGSTSRIKVYNITDPYNPTLVYNKADGITSSWRDFKTYRNYLYAVSEGGTAGLAYICLDSLSNNSYNNTNTAFNTAHNIWVDTTTARLYAVGINTGGIAIFDISTPNQPTFLKTFNTGMYTHDIFVRNHIGYASNGFSGTFAYNFSDVNNIVQTAFGTLLTDYNHSTYPNEDNTILYSALEYPNGIPLVAYSINGTNNMPLTIKKRFRPTYNGTVVNNTPHNPFVHNGKLYVSYYQDGVAVFDLSNPLDPQLMAYYDTSPGAPNYIGYSGCWGVYPFFRSGTVVASDIQTGLYVLGLNTKITSDKDIVLTTSGTAITFKHNNGIASLSVNDAGILIWNSQSTAPPVPAQSKYADMHSSSGSFVLRSPNGSYYKLVLNNGVLTSSAYNYIANTVTEISGDIYFPDTNRSVLLKDQSLTGLYRLKCSNTGLINFFKSE